MSHYKKSPDGERERIALLQGLFGPIDAGIILSRCSLLRQGIARDDVVDALGCLATARRLSTSTSLTLPRGHGQLDSRGLRMEIVA
jgi:predicted RNase H-like nuclease